MRKVAVIAVWFLVLAPALYPLGRPAGSGGEASVYLTQSTSEEEDLPNISVGNMSELLGLGDMWELGHNGTGVTVAVLDTGVDSGHSELAGAVAESKTFVEGIESGDPMDYEGHGTVVAGIVGARGIGDGRYAGVAPGASLLNLKVMNGTGEGYLDWVVEAIDYAVERGARVVSVSLGADPEGRVYAEEAIRGAWERGVAVITASGNEGPAFSTVGAPGNVLEAITVGSCSLDGYILSFSSTGPTPELGLCKPDLVAPGAFVIGPASSRAVYADEFYYEKERYSVQSGTSVSTPLVSGIVALLMGATNATPAEIKTALLQSATDLGYSCYRQGAGVPSAIGSYRLLTNESWEPALFLPSKMPQLPLEREDVPDYPLVLLTGRDYEGARLETELPLLLPEFDGRAGHHILQLEVDGRGLLYGSGEEGEIRLVSAAGTVLARARVEIAVGGLFNLAVLVFASGSILALSGVAGTITFGLLKRRGAPKCDPAVDPNCRID
jgi:subtilisin family serine protease